MKFEIGDKVICLSSNRLIEKGMIYIVNAVLNLPEGSLLTLNSFPGVFSGTYFRKVQNENCPRIIIKKEKENVKKEK